MVCISDGGPLFWNHGYATATDSFQILILLIFVKTIDAENIKTIIKSVKLDIYNVTRYSVNKFDVTKTLGIASR